MHLPSKSNQTNRPLPQNSPVEERRQQLPQGDGKWAGYAYVYGVINIACNKMGENPKSLRSEEHVNAMAVLGCGHEETMKAEMWKLRDLGFASFSS